MNIYTVSIVPAGFVGLAKHAYATWSDIIPLGQRTHRMIHTLRTQPALTPASNILSIIIQLSTARVAAEVPRFWTISGVRYGKSPSKSRRRARPIGLSKKIAIVVNIWCVKPGSAGAA